MTVLYIMTSTGKVKSIFRISMLIKILINRGNSLLLQLLSFLLWQYHNIDK